MEKSTAQENKISPVKAIKRTSLFIPIGILLGFLAAAITYRIVTLNDLDSSNNLLLHYEEIAQGRDSASLLEDRVMLNRIVVQLLHDNGRAPSQEEIATKARELADAGDMAAEMQAQKDRFTFFLDCVIYGLAGILLIFLLVSIRRRKLSRPF